MDNPFVKLFDPITEAFPPEVITRVFEADTYPFPDEVIVRRDPASGACAAVSGPTEANWLKTAHCGRPLRDYGKEGHLLRDYTKA